MPRSLLGFWDAFPSIDKMWSAREEGPVAGVLFPELVPHATVRWVAGFMEVELADGDLNLVFGDFDL